MAGAMPAPGPPPSIGRTALESEYVPIVDTVVHAKTTLDAKTVYLLQASGAAPAGAGGLGMGDAKLLAAIGAWLGLSLLPVTLFIAACSGLVAAAGATLTGRRMTAATAIPFGPFLALAAWLLWLYASNADSWPWN